MPGGFIPGYPVPKEQWAEKGESCPGCGRRFTFFTSKSNCPNCGRLYCADCLQAECTIVPGGSPVQTCLPCFSMLQDVKRRQFAAQEEQAMQLSPARTAVVERGPTSTPQRDGRLPEDPDRESDSAANGTSAPFSAAEYDEMKQQIGNLLEKSRSLRNENEELLTNAKLKDDVIASATESLNAERDRSARQEQQLRELKATTVAAQAESQALSERLQALTKEVEGNDQLESRCNAYLQELEAMKEKMTEEDSRRDRDQRESAQNAAATIARLESRVHELEAAASDSNNQVQTVQQHLQGELRQAQEILRETELQLRSAQQERDHIEQMYDTKEKELSEVREMLAATTLRLEQLSEEHTAATAERVALLTQHAEAHLREKEKISRDLQEAMERVRSEEENATRLTASNNSAREELLSQLHAKETELESLYDEKKSLEERLSILERHHTTKEAEQGLADQDNVTSVEKLQPRDATGTHGDTQVALAETSRGASATDAESHETSHIAAVVVAAENENKLSGELASYREKLAGVAAELEEATEALKASEENSVTLQSLVDELTEAKNRAEAAQATAEAAVASTTSETNAETRKLRATAKQAAQQTQALREQLKEKDHRLTLIQDDKASLEKKGKEQQKLVKQLQQSNAELKTRSDQAEAALKTSEDNAAKASAEAKKQRAELQRALDAANKELSNFKEAYELALGALGCRLDSEHEGGAPRATTAVAAAVLPPRRDGGSKWREPSIVQPITFAVPKPAELKFTAGHLPSDSTLFVWGYDVAGAAEMVPSIFQCVATAAAKELHLFPDATGQGHDKGSLRRWQTMAAMVEANYNDNPYHTAVHAADVTQGLCTLLLAAHEEVTQHLSRAETLGAVFAAMIHDVRHPGRSRDFLRRSFDPVFFSFNGINVLEQMHISTSFALLAVPEADFTEGMSERELLEFHHTVTSMVIATDMSLHSKGMANWQTKALAHTFDFTKADDRAEVLALLLHAADIGAQSKGRTVALRWLSVIEEMYQQGDEEAARNYPVSFACARPTASSAPFSDVGSLTKEEIAGQLAFMRAFVIPMYYVVRAIIPSFSAPLVNLQELHTLYQQRCEDTKPFPAPPEVTPAPTTPLLEANGGPEASAASKGALRDSTEADKRLIEEQAKALREVHNRVKLAAADIAARDVAVRQKEDSLRSLEARVVEGLRGLSAARGESQQGFEASTGGHDAIAAAGGDQGSTKDIEEKLLRAAAKVVERERQIHNRARALEKQAKDLEEREQRTADLSDQLTAIAERVNRQRRKLARREAQLSLSARAADEDDRLSREQQSTTRSRSTTTGNDAAFHLQQGKEVILQRLSEAVQHLSSAVSYAP